MIFLSYLFSCDARQYVSLNLLFTLFFFFRGEAAKSNILSSIGSVTETIKEKLTMPKDKVEPEQKEEEGKASDY